MATPAHNFAPQRGDSPALNTVQDKIKAALDLLADQVERAVKAAQAAATSAASAAAFQKITFNTYNELRAVMGDPAGKAGPRGVIVAGTTAPKDGGEGVFVWDFTSTAVDNNATVIAPVNAAGTVIQQGRWRKV